MGRSTDELPEDDITRVDTRETGARETDQIGTGSTGIRPMS